MTKALVNLQDLRRRIYRKAKSDQEHRFWGLFAHIAKIETLGARRRNPVEEMPAITVSGKCRHRRQGDGSGRSTVDGRAPKRARREGPGPVSTPLGKARQG